MRRIAQLLAMGINYFGSGSYNTQQFLEFFELFKKSFTSELKKLGATSIEFSRGHFYLSGFFYIGEQCYYFSLSDVRSGIGKPEKLLIRTAKHNKDYTGGSNRYVEIKPGIHKQLAYMLGVEIKQPKRKAHLSTEDFVAGVIEKGGFEGRIESTKKAQRIGFELLRTLGEKAIITESKLGRFNVCSKFENDKAYFYYNAQSKRLTIEIR